jgi:TolB-like protein/Flp pilus assembly protein TadD
VASNSRFVLNLVGPFRLLEPNGERIAVPSKKGVALLAMLAVAQNGERARGWLQDKLWGQRQATEARGSLRRELSNLRKRLNRGATPLLICERDRVRLDLALLDIDLFRERSAGRSSENSPASSGEFLEGLDIAGEDGFEDWLREFRTSAKADVGRRQAGSSQAETLAAPSAAARIISEPTAPALAQFDRKEGEAPSLAVLKFANLTGDPGRDYLADGVGEELINRLARQRWLPVIARGSSFAFSDSSDRGLVARTLGARYLVEGALHGFGDGHWITARLTDAQTGHSLWSQRYDLPSPTLSGAFDRCIIELSAHLGAKVDLEQQARVHRAAEDSASVSDLIWRGRWHVNRLTRADSVIARRLFAEALALNPASFEAHIQATHALAWEIWAGRQPKEKFNEICERARRAMLLDPDDCRGYWLAGVAETWLRNPATALGLLDQAIAINPSLEPAHAQLGGTLNLCGRPADAIGHLQTALRLSPNDLHAFYRFGELAMTFNMLGRWQEALEYADRAIILRPAYWYARMIKVHTLVQTGEFKAANGAMQSLLEVKPQFSRAFVEWIPFVDRSWVDRICESIDLARGASSAGGRATAANPGVSKNKKLRR